MHVHFYLRVTHGYSETSFLQVNDQFVLTLLVCCRDHSVTQVFIVSAWCWVVLLKHAFTSRHTCSMTVAGLHADISE